MDRNLGLSPAISDGPPLTVAAADPSFDTAFPEADSEDMAQRELYLTLQLLANRAQQLSRASAATIAVGEGERLLCRASAGPMAAVVGSELRANPALIEKSIQTQQIVCCNYTGNLANADGIPYAALGIKSMMVMPLVEDQRVVAIFELLADRTQAFQDGDGAMLQLLSAMVLTALHRAEAAQRAQQEIANLCREFGVEGDNESGTEARLFDGSQTSAAQSPPAIETVGTCQVCNFPVSEGRSLCLDCEEASHQYESRQSAPEFLSQLASEGRRSWFESHFYTLGTLLMVLLTVIVLLLKFH